MLRQNITLFYPSDRTTMVSCHNMVLQWPRKKTIVVLRHNIMLLNHRQKTMMILRKTWRFSTSRNNSNDIMSRYGVSLLQAQHKNGTSSFHGFSSLLQ